MKKINEAFIEGQKEMSADFNIKNIFEVVYDHHANCDHSNEGEKKGKDEDEGSGSDTKKSDDDDSGESDPKPKKKKKEEKPQKPTTLKDKKA